MYVRPWLLGKRTVDLSVGPSKWVVSKETDVQEDWPSFLNNFKSKHSHRPRQWLDLPKDNP